LPRHLRHLIDREDHPLVVDTDDRNGVAGDGGDRAAGPLRIAIPARVPTRNRALLVGVGLDQARINGKAFTPSMTVSPPSRPPRRSIVSGGRSAVLQPGQMAGANPAFRPIVWTSGIIQFCPYLDG
jgi:hypothetical protein